MRVLKTIGGKSFPAPKIDRTTRRTAVYRVVFYRVSTRNNICHDRLLRRKGRRTSVSFALYSLLLFLVPSESNFVLLVSQTLIQSKYNKHGYPPDDRQDEGNILTAAADHDENAAEQDAASNVATTDSYAKVADSAAASSIAETAAKQAVTAATTTTVQPFRSPPPSILRV